MSYNPGFIELFLSGRIGFGNLFLTVSFYLLGFETARWVFSLLHPPYFSPVSRRIDTMSGSDAVIVSNVIVCQLATTTSACIVSELRYENRVQSHGQQSRVASGANNMIIIIAGNKSWRSQ